MSASNLPEISAEAVDAVFSVLSVMEVGLDDDPLQYGPKRLNGKIADARGKLTECEGLFLKVSKWLQKYRAAQRTLETELDLAKKELFANDPEVRAGRNVADRDALATMKLQDQVRTTARVTQTQCDLEAVLTVIKAKRVDLKDVQARIRDQIKLCHDEIGLGSRWGSKPSPGTEAPDLEAAPNVDKQTLKDLHEMFTGSRHSEPDLATIVSVVEVDPVVETEPSKPSGAALPYRDGGHDLYPLNPLSDDTADEYLSAIVAPAVEESKSLRSISDLLEDLDL
jgi:hypothetical protein